MVEGTLYAVGGHDGPLVTMFLLFFTGVGVVEGTLYAVGGHDGPLVRKSVEMYDPDANDWKQAGEMHLCRRNAGNLMMFIIS